jgi:soluble lytic murein transglycosylase
MRVTESLPNYRARLSGQTAKINFRSELKGDYVALAPPLAPAVSVRPVNRPRS